MYKDKQSVLSAGRILIVCTPAPVALNVPGFVDGFKSALRDILSLQCTFTIYVAVIEPGLIPVLKLVLSKPKVLVM